MAENDLERKELRTAQMRALHQAIGEFAVEFETVTHQEWRCVNALLEHVGLHDQGVAQVLFADYTSEPMRAMLQSLIGEVRKPDAAEAAIVKNLLDRHQKLISRRNEVMHGTWLIGWGNEEKTDWGTAVGWKLGKNKQGAKVKGFRYRVEDFNELTGNANALSKAFSRLAGCYSGGFEVEKNFDVADDGTVSAPNKGAKEID